jgi:hypothetical protein
MKIVYIVVMQPTVCIVHLNFCIVLENRLSFFCDVREVGVNVILYERSLKSSIRSAYAQTKFNRNPLSSFGDETCWRTHRHSLNTSCLDFMYFVQETHTNKLNLTAQFSCVPVTCAVEPISRTARSKNTKEVRYYGVGCLQWGKLIEPSHRSESACLSPEGRRAVDCVEEKTHCDVWAVCTLDVFMRGFLE